jgi:23S rRNA (cytidine1920-2'-O)/16S rRNA (cytidine1409-2'-O)-methyltransferase
LNFGAEHIYSVDVGYNQIDYSLRKNPQVTIYERTNIMSLKKYPQQPHAAVADLSFRSIKGAAAHLLNIVIEGWIIALIKPQFEVDKNLPGFHGIIQSNKLLIQVLLEVVEQLWIEESYVEKILPSPITGRKGNKEFLFLINKTEKKKKEVIFQDIRNLLS